MLRQQKEADADENKRPSVYIKWVKTFKNIDEAINTEITAANNWGDNPTTLVTAKSGFSTYAAAYPVNYNEAGIDAYTVKLDKDKQEVTYTKFTGVVPAGKAVLVKGTPEQLYDLPVATESADETLLSQTCKHPMELSLLTIHHIMYLPPSMENQASNV